MVKSDGSSSMLGVDVANYRLHGTRPRNINCVCTEILLSQGQTFKVILCWL